jgi:hypothetical protein
MLPQQQLHCNRGTVSSVRFKVVISVSQSGRINPLRTTDMDTETTVTENTVLEQEAPRKPGRPPPIVMTSTTNLIPKLKILCQWRARVPKYTKWNLYPNE